MFETVEVPAPPEMPAPPEEVGWPDFDPGRGPQWSTYLPDGLLADMLERESGEGPQWERLERIGAWERIVAWAQASQLREMATFAHAAEQVAARHAAARAVARAAGQPVTPEVGLIEGQESAAAEISLMLRIAPVTASSRLDDALTLTGRYPATVAALAAGRITLCKARIIAEQTEQLSDDHAAAVQARVLEQAKTQTPGQLRRSVRRAVVRADPAAVRRRHEAATRARGVGFWELPDGMAMVSACLPAGEAVGVYGVLDEYARATGGAGDDRTVSARRADALVDLVCGSAGYLSTGTRIADAGASRPDRRRRRSRVRVQVRVTVPFSTLFGLDEQPGELAGYGTITAEQARELAAQGTWRRILTDPATGAPTDYGTTVYRAPTALRDLVLSRTPTCGSPRAWPPPTGAMWTTANPMTLLPVPGPPTNTASTPTAAATIARNTPKDGQSTGTTAAPSPGPAPADTRGPTIHPPSPNPHPNVHPNVHPPVPINHPRSEAARPMPERMTTAQPRAASRAGQRQ